jgi:hypothetical protein
MCVCEVKRGGGLMTTCSLGDWGGGEGVRVGSLHDDDQSCLCIHERHISTQGVQIMCLENKQSSERKVKSSRIW